MMSTASANCFERYETLIAKKVKAKKITNIAGWTTTGVLSVGLGTMGYVGLVMEYGTANIGILVGAQIGSFFAIPLGTIILTTTGIQKGVLLNYVKAYQALKATSGDSTANQNIIRRNRL